MNSNRLTYPLVYPSGWHRLTARERIEGRFSRGGQPIAIVAAVGRVLKELALMSIQLGSVVVSTNVRPGQIWLYVDQPGTDPGGAVYWTQNGGNQCMACDRYFRVADNIAAIAATLSALRSIKRHGGTEIQDRAFAGFAALPASEEPWQILGLSGGPGASVTEIEKAYRRLAMRHHPDRGGDPQMMQRINAARDAMLATARTI